MPSPFPGMDPYVEARWLDFHLRFVAWASRAIQRQLGDDLIAAVEERIVVEEPGNELRTRIGPDVRVVEIGPTAHWSPNGGVAVAEPLHFEEIAEPIEQRFIEIRDLTLSGNVVTVIELVSPTNKLPGDGQNQYLKKQTDCWNARVNLVEIDLNRTGMRKLLAHRFTGTRRHESTYQVSSWRAVHPGAVDLYPISIRQALPKIKIPLRLTDDDIHLDLQAVFNECFADARYDRIADYRKDSDPPLQGDDAAWADTLLRAAGRR